MQVRVYFNLHTKLWSVQDAKTRRVIGHASKLLIREARFVVSEAGRQRVLREQKKNVHAFVVGELEAAAWVNERIPSKCHYNAWDFCPRSNRAYAKAARKYGYAVSYNPYKGSTFTVLASGISPEPLPIHEAPMVCLEGRSVLYFDPCNMTADESAAATE